MMTNNRILVRAGIDDVYRIAAEVVDWPRLLSHYRWVRILDGSLSDGHCTVEMAASRDGFPCSWRSRMDLFPEEHRIHYTHIRSTWTFGMDVWWTLREVDGGLVEATITHEMARSTPVTELFRRHVVGKLFVEDIADKTLHGLKRHLERGSA